MKTYHIHLIYFFIVIFLWALAPVTACPSKYWDPPRCDEECHCDWSHSIDCDNNTGQCICESGYDGSTCESDINECMDLPDPCALNEYCVNTAGSYSCKCRSGTRRGIDESCRVCVPDCETCNCEIKNHQYCDTRGPGVCVCLPGWEGPSCTDSVDDCVDVVCASGKCRDLHRKYYCDCGKNKLLVNKKCGEYRVEFFTNNRHPAIGELVDLYVVYSLPADYQSGVTSGPDFHYRLTVTNETYDCEISLHKNWNAVQGNEWFLSKLMPDLTYDYFSLVKLYFLTEGSKKATATPFSDAFDELGLTFEVEYASPAARNCLTGMSISNTKPFTYPWYAIRRKKYAMSRQEYKLFTLALNSTSLCVQAPRMIWEYIHITELPTPKSKLCLDGSKFHKKDISKLIGVAEEQELTDHKGLIEIIPKNTIPVGHNLLCVKAYVDKDVDNFATTCGMIRVDRSNKVAGSINPRPHELTVLYTMKSVHVSTDYWDPDVSNNPEGPLDANINIYLHCQIFKDKYGERHLRHPWVIIAKSCDTRRYGRNIDLNLQKWNGHPPHHRPTKIRYQIEAWIPKFRWGYSVRDTVTMTYHYPSLSGIRTMVYLSFRCTLNCQRTINANKIVVLQVSSVYEKRIHHLDIKVQSTIYEDGVELNDTRHFQIIQKHRLHAASKDKPVAIIARNLKPGKNYMFEFTNKDVGHRNTPVAGYVSYKFSTFANPQGKGCTINPTTGSAVFTEFTVECKNYKDMEQNLPLSYALVQKDRIVGEKKEIDTLIAYSGLSLMKNIKLSKHRLSSEVGKQLDIQLEVIISTVTGSSTLVPLKVTLNFDDQATILERVQTTTQVLRGSDSQENVRGIKNIASVMNVKSTATEENKTLVRQQLLSNLNSYRTETSSGVEHSSFTMQAAVAEEAEIHETGLNDGMESVCSLIKYLGKIPSDDGDRLSKVAETQFFAVDKLVSVMHDIGSVAGKDQSTDSRSLDQYKTNSKQAMTAMSTMGRVLSHSLIGDNTRLWMHAKNMDMSTEWQKVREATKFDLKAEDGVVNFQLPTKHLGLKEEGIRNTFGVYRKSPFGWASNEVKGDLPVATVAFSSLSKLKSDTETWRFSRPADIVINYNITDEKAIDYSLTMRAHSITGEVLQSDCKAMSVTVSTKDYTVLRIESPNNLTVKVVARYTNSIGAFELLTDHDMMEFPYINNETHTSTNGVLHRQKDLLFLPQLTKNQFDKSKEFFRLRLSIKLGQKVPPGLTPIFEEDTGHNATNMTQLFNTSIRVTPYKMSCVHFDQEKEKMASDDCKMSEFSRPGRMNCKCLVAAAYTGSFVVAPILINPLGVGLFSKVFDNPLVVSMTITIWMIFIAGVIWGRKKDKNDTIRSAATVLEDNKEDHTYVYLVCVVTGMSPKAGTSSNVFMFFRGTWAITMVHMFTDRTKMLFQMGSEDWFVMATKGDIGDITSVMVWTDSSGYAPSWFLSSVYIQDLQTGNAWICRFNGWISDTLGLGRLVVEVPATKEAELSSEWQAQILSMAKNNLRNNHLWVGMLAKTSYNKFSRVQRFATGLTMLQTLMMCNLMFFGVMDVDDSRQFLKIGNYTLHMTSIIIGLQTSIVITILGQFVAFLFRRIRSKEPRTVTDASEKQSESGEKKGKDTPSSFTHSTGSSGFSRASEYTEDETEDEDDSPAHTTPRKSRHRASASKRDSTHSAHSEKNISQHNSTSPELPTYKNQSELKKAEEDFKKKVAAAKNKKKDDIDVEAAHEDEEEEMPEDADTNVFRLPHWCIYFTWGFLAVYNAFLAYYTMLFGLSMGYESSVDWVMSFFTGFLSNAFVMQPLQIMGWVIIYVVVFKYKHTYKDQAPLTALDEGLALVQRQRIISATSGQLAFTQDIQSSGPANSAMAQAVLKRIRIEGRAREMVRDLLIYIVFMVAVLFVVLGHLDVTTRFMQTDNVKRRFTNDLDLGEAMTTEDMWDYLLNTAVPLLTPNDKGNVLGDDLYLLGTARMRQVRIHPDAGICDNQMAKLIEHYGKHMCSYTIQDGKEDTRTFTDSWEKPAKQVTENSDSPYIYRTARKLNGNWFNGDHGSYPGGGYISVISQKDRFTVASTINEFKNSEWINHLTRCLFIEFTLFNPNTNMFTGAMIAFEFTNFGGIYPMAHFVSAKLLHYTEENRSWLETMETISFVCVVVNTVIHIKLLMTVGWSVFFRNFWNCLEVCLIFLSYLAAPLFYYRYVAVADAVRQFQTFGSTRFTNFHDVFDDEERLQVVVGLIAGLVIIKMLKLIAFNPFMAIFTKAFEIAHTDILGFAVLAVVFICGSAFAGMFLFGHSLFEYSTPLQSLYSIQAFILGEPDFDGFMDVSVEWGRAFFLIEMIVTQYIIMNLFIAVLREGFELARYMRYHEEEQTLHYLINSVRLYLGMFPKQYQ